MARLLDPRNGPAFDLPPCTGASAYVIASTPRSGSTLLARMLWDHGQAGAPKEYLNPMQLRDWEVRFGSRVSRARHAMLWGPTVGFVGRRWTERRVEGQIRRVRARRSSGGWFGLKLHWHHHQQFFAHRSLDDVLGPVTWIRIRRRDQVAQAVSWEIARQTGRWVDTQTAWRHPLYMRSRVDLRLTDLVAAEAGWDERLRGRPCIDVVYEDLADDPARAVRKVLTALDVAPRPMPSPPLQQMTSPMQADWIARYRENRDD